MRKMKVKEFIHTHSETHIHSFHTHWNTCFVQTVQVMEISETISDSYNVHIHFIGNTMLNITSPPPEELPLLYNEISYVGMGAGPLEKGHGDFRIQYLVTLCKIPSTLAYADAPSMLSYIICMMMNDLGQTGSLFSILGIISLWFTNKNQWGQ